MSVPADPLRLVVITVSDRASAGIYPDRSGPRAEELAREHLATGGCAVTAERRLVPDERDRIAAELRAAVAGGADLVLTTGGTGIGPRDVTPEATREVLAREIPGLMEAARAASPAAAPGALLSRAVAGVAGSSLILNLPGSVKAVEEYLAVLLPAVPHALAMIRGAAGGDDSAAPAGEAGTAADSTGTDMAVCSMCGGRVPRVEAVILDGKLLCAHCAPSARDRQGDGAGGR